MDKLVAFFKNVWLRRGVALICWAYTGLLCWVAWLNFAFYFEFENATALFVLYLFVNIAALGLMIFTRKQVITMINSMILPPIVFVIVIFGFGNWYMILPPLCVVAAMFFINGSNETLKTVLGTLYLLMYVIGVVAYIAINLLMGRITFNSVDLTLRDGSYENVSPSGNYRIVRYVDKPNGDRRTASYYIECAAEDVEIPFGKCKKVFGSERVLTSKYTSRTDDPIQWVQTKLNGVTTEMLDVEGSIMENPYLKKERLIKENNSGPTFSVMVMSGTYEAEDTAESNETTIL